MEILFMLHIAFTSLGTLVGSSFVGSKALTWTFYKRMTLTWKEAAQFCRERQAYLPVTNNSVTMTAFQDASKTLSFDEVWIGLHSRVVSNAANVWEADCSTVPEGVWYWAEHEPNNIDSDLCVRVNGGEWKTIGCSSRYGVVCEEDIETHDDGDYETPDSTSTLTLCPATYTASAEVEDSYPPGVVSGQAVVTASPEPNTTAVTATQPPTQANTIGTTTTQPSTQPNTIAATTTQPSTQPNTIAVTTTQPSTQPNTIAATTTQPSTQANTIAATTTQPSTQANTIGATTIQPSTQPNTIAATTTQPSTQPNTIAATTTQPSTQPNTIAVTTTQPSTQPNTIAATTTQPSTQPNTIAVTTTQPSTQPNTITATTTQPSTQPNTNAVITTQSSPQSGTVVTTTEILVPATTTTADTTTTSAATAAATSPKPVTSTTKTSTPALTEEEVGCKALKNSRKCRCAFEDNKYNTHQPSSGDNEPRPTTPLSVATELVVPRNTSKQRRAKTSAVTTGTSYTVIGTTWMAVISSGFGVLVLCDLTRLCRWLAKRKARAERRVQNAP